LPADRNNSVVDLVELIIDRRAGNDPEGSDRLHVDLRAGTAEIDDMDSGVFFSVSISEARLVLQLEGLDIKMGTRHGEPTRADEIVRTTVTEEESTKAQIAAGGRIAASSAATGAASASASGRVDKGWQQLSQRTTETIDQHIAVKARGGNTWHISERNGAKLDGSYLSDTVICELKRDEGVNRTSIRTIVLAKQRAVNITPGKGGLVDKFTSRKKQLLSILIAKTIDPLRAERSGDIVLSESSIEDAD